jgi:hypothetical protein
MTKSQLKKMYNELNLWVESNIGDDILNESARPEYQELVQEQRDKGISDEDIPQQVLWALRAKLNEMKEDTEALPSPDLELPGSPIQGSYSDYVAQNFKVTDISEHQSKQKAKVKLQIGSVLVEIYE